MSPNTWLWVPKLQKISPLYNSCLLLSPRWPLWRGSTVFKNTLEVSNYHVHLYVANCSIFNFLFSFSGRTEQKDLSWKGLGKNFRCSKVAPTIHEVKDIIATGKRSQVARLVCKLSFILLVVTYWILGKDLVLEMFADTGQEVTEWGRYFAEISCC